MADTTFIKRVIEPHLRQQLASRFPGHIFEERSLPVANGSIRYDAVSSDGAIVALFLCSRPETATGNENTGGVRKVLRDVDVLKAVTASRRLLVCTDDGFRELAMRKSKRFGNDGIEFIHIQLPDDLQRQLDACLDASRGEQRNRND